MSVVTVEKYRVVTGDYVAAASAIQPLLDMAEGMLDDELGRTLAYGTYTEKLRVWPFGFVYPRAVPVESVPASTGATVHDAASVMGATPDESLNGTLEWVGYERNQGRSVGERIGIGYEARFSYATLTYIGGWTSETMPEKLQWWIAKLAQSLAPGASGSRPAGSAMARVGDVQVSYDKAQIAGSMDQFLPGITKALKGYYLGR